MAKVYIADKETLDNVKQDTQYIKNQFPLQVSGGIDWSKYDSWIIKKNFEIKYKGKTTLLEIEGKGYVNHIFAREGNDGDLIITIDDKQVLNSYLTNSINYRVCPGIYNVNNLQTTESSSTGHYLYADSLILIGKSPDVNSDYYKFLNNKLFFNKKVKVEINSNIDNNSICLYYNIGVEK